VHAQETLKVPQLAEWNISVKDVPRILPNLRPWSLWSRIAPLVNRFLVKRYWNKVGADVYHASHYSLPQVSGPMCCTVHDMIPEKFPKSFSKAAYKELVESKRDIVMRADKIICVSENTKRDLVAMLNIDPDKCSVIYNAGYPDELTRGIGWSSAEEATHPFVFYVGGYKAAYKNFKFMVDGLAELNLLGIDKYRLIVASPEVPSATELANYHDLFGRGVVEFKSDCTDEDLIKLYGECSLFIMPSKYEGFGIPVLEALSCGAPVVCSDSSSLPEVGGDVVSYFGPDNYKEFVSAVELALIDGRNKDKVKKRKDWAATFSWDRAAEEFCDVVRDLAGKNY
jgi:glycosyltransferase involved in cell wall biosynthesis